MANLLWQVLQAFINYNFPYTRFCAHKTVLGACPCLWEIVSIKGQTCTLLIITWHSSRKYTKLVLKPLAAKTASLFQSCILLLSCRSYYFSLHDHYPPLFGPFSRASLTNLMLITAFYLCQPKHHHEPRNRIGLLSLGECLAGFEPWTFQFSSQCLNPLGHFPQLGDLGLLC